MGLAMWLGFGGPAAVYAEPRLQGGDVELNGFLGTGSWGEGDYDSSGVALQSPELKDEGTLGFRVGYFFSRRHEVSPMPLGLVQGLCFTSEWRSLIMIIGGFGIACSRDLPELGSIGSREDDSRGGFHPPAHQRPAGSYLSTAFARRDQASGVPEGDDGSGHW